VEYVLCTLLGPEGPGRFASAFLKGNVGVGLDWVFWILVSSHECLSGCVVGEDTARTLRTTQWTRASTRSYQIMLRLSGRGVTWCVSCYVYQ
jgi:hypothetical protein